MKSPDIYGILITIFITCGIMLLKNINFINYENDSLIKRKLFENEIKERICMQ